MRHLIALELGGEDGREEGVVRTGGTGKRKHDGMRGVTRRAYLLRLPMMSSMHSVIHAIMHNVVACIGVVVVMSRVCVLWTTCFVGSRVTNTHTHTHTHWEVWGRERGLSGSGEQRMRWFACAFIDLTHTTVGYIHNNTHTHHCHVDGTPDAFSSSEEYLSPPN